MWRWRRERDHHAGNEGENVKAGQYCSGSYNGDGSTIPIKNFTHK